MSFLHRSAVSKTPFIPITYIQCLLCSSRDSWGSKNTTHKCKDCGSFSTPVTYIKTINTMNLPSTPPAFNGNTAYQFMFDTSTPVTPSLFPNSFNTNSEDSNLSSPIPPIERSESPDIYSLSSNVCNMTLSNLNHDFVQKLFPEPIPCLLCDQPIWGKGVKCNQCSLDLHKGCSEKTGLPHCVITTTESRRPLSETNMESDLYESLLQYSASRRNIVSQDILSDHRNSGSVLTTTPSLRRNISKTKNQPRRSQIHSHIFSSNNTANYNEPRVDEMEISSRSPGKYKRKIHYFRGHNFIANFLETESSCAQCLNGLCDGGRQCYKCSSCSMTVHKRCYTKTKPCSVTVRPLNTKYISDDANVSFIRRSRITTDEGIEDFSDELISITDNAVTCDNNEEDIHKHEEMRDFVVESHVLGAGKFGIVQKGFYKHNPKEKVAIKIIDRRKFTSAAQRNTETVSSLPEFLKRELDILQRLDHDGVIRMHHFIVTLNQTVLIIMDFAPLGDLLDYIVVNKKVSEKESQHLMKQVTSALKYLHERNICHRDLKPENLLLFHGDNGKKNIKIADFGYATIIEQVSGSSISQMRFLESVVGTPAYRAPEVVDGRVWLYVAPHLRPKKDGFYCGYDKSSDMWSFGVILYITLGGIFPFHDAKPILDQILEGDFFFPDEQFDDVSDVAIELICMCLQVNPCERLQAHESTSHNWFKK